MLSKRNIELRGVRVNNLQDIDLDIPHGQLVSICGVSGSGKSSLAFDTLYAEGQRRYFESLSTYSRQFLEQLDKPDADRIEGIPPAIAIRANRQGSAANNDRNRMTVGSASEILPYLRMLYARIAEVICPTCNISVNREDPDSVASFLHSLPPGAKFQVAFRILDPQNTNASSILQNLRSNGFRRMIVNGITNRLDDDNAIDVSQECLVVVDRLVAGQDSMARAAESLETAFAFANQSVVILWMDGKGQNDNRIIVDGKDWSIREFRNSLACSICQTEFATADAQLFNYSSPIGACHVCEGLGTIQKLDMNLIVPDDSISIRDGAVAPWNTPAYEHEKIELVDLATDFGVNVEIPFRELSDDAIALIWNGVPERSFGGMNGFFNWLEKKKYKVQVAAFLMRWKADEQCARCQGARLNSDALAYVINRKNIAELCDFEIDQTIQFLSELTLSESKMQTSASLLSRVVGGLEYLAQVGLSYVTLNRSISSLSSGESQRVMLTKVLGSTLTSMLYVLDEPTSGLHPSETQMLVESTKALSQRGNTVVIVDHDTSMIESANRIIEIGPGAGRDGGNIVFDGSSSELAESEESVTGHFIAKRAGLRNPENKRRKPRGMLKLHGASGNNLRNINIEFPLGCLCVVSGVSGSGKSTLVHQTLYPAISQRKQLKCKPPMPYSDLFGETNFDDIVVVDQSPIGRSSRSNPVTYVKAFDEIRMAFAETVDAKARSFKAGHFSFNVDGGRCERCRGEGQLTIDMQFMSDIHVRCTECQGTRFREAILEVRYRAKTIDDVLNMSAREAFGFFRGKTKVQARLKALIDVGLEYICLGQPASTLSSGEAQRLKLAHYLNAPKSRKALFILDEPTFGLHMHDILKLVDCFETLLDAGHSLIVIEHNLQLMKYADWIIDLGPGASNQGGSIVAQGTPEVVAETKDSITGQLLKKLFQAESAALNEIS